MPTIGRMGRLMWHGGGFDTFSPLSLFAAGEQGVWYDPSDFSTMFQDSVGATPVTAAGQTVGLILDKSRGLALGPELVTNGAFGSGTTDWTNSSSGTGSFAVTSGAARIIGTDGANRGAFSQAIPFVAGKAYQVSFTASITSGAVSAFGVLTGTGGISVTNGVNSRVIVASAAFGGVFYTQSSGANATIDNISVREILGTHATQSTASLRPLLQQDATERYYLSFDGVDDGLVTANIAFTASNKIMLAAGVRKMSDAAVGTVCEFSSNFLTNNGSFVLYAPDAAGAGRYYFGSRGTDLATSTSTSLAPTTNVLTGVADIAAPSATLRLNGVASITSTSTQGSGNYGEYPLFIGRRSGGGRAFNGRLYGMIARGGAVTASQVEQTEAWLNGKTGAY